MAKKRKLFCPVLVGFLVVFFSPLENERSGAGARWFLELQTATAVLGGLLVQRYSPRGQKVEGQKFTLCVTRCWV